MSCSFVSKVYDNYDKVSYFQRNKKCYNLETTFQKKVNLSQSVRFIRSYFLIIFQILVPTALICIKIHLGSTFVVIINSKKSNIVVGSVYKHPNMDVLDFNSLINQHLEKISKEQKQIFLFGDFNINLPNYDEHQPNNEFLDACLKFYHSILNSSSITIFFSNVVSCKAIYGNITTTISDHLPWFLFAPNVLSNPSCYK